MPTPTARWSIDQLQDIWKFVSALHQGQTYGSPQPGERLAYVSHLGSVAFEVMQALEHETDLDADLCLSCALLHDSIEDTPCTYENLQQRFGNAIADGVLALTKNETLPTKNEQMQDSLSRIVQQPREIGVVKLADRINNLSEPPHYWTNDKKHFYQQEAQMIYNALHHCSPYLAARLATKINHYEQFIEP